MGRWQSQRESSQASRPLCGRIEALEDPNRLEEIDTRFQYDEERLRIIGMARGRVLLVVVTYRGEDICRIISARKATKYEQDRYYAGDGETW
jgi:uncharacterized protein